MKVSLRVGLLSLTALFAAGALIASAPAASSKPVQVAEIFSICTYKGASGTKYLGMSSGDCDSACTSAYNKCVDAGDAPCKRQGCTATE